ncbi:MAG: cytochrome c [Polyangiales bacterium]
MRTALLSAVLAVSCVPKNYTPTEQVPNVVKIKDLMDIQATAADPQFKKIDAASFSDEDWGQFKELSRKIDATSKKLKSFSKGAGFDALADRLNEKANALGKAAEGKDAPAAKTALAEMKDTCKECHSQFR